MCRPLFVLEIPAARALQMHDKASPSRRIPGQFPAEVHWLRWYSLGYERIYNSGSFDVATGWYGSRTQSVIATPRLYHQRRRCCIDRLKSHSLEAVAGRIGAAPNTTMPMKISAHLFIFRSSFPDLILRSINNLRCIQLHYHVISMIPNVSNNVPMISNDD